MKGRFAAFFVGETFMKKFLAGLALMLVAAFLLLPALDSTTISGELVLPGLNAPVRIVRDQQGIPSIYAQDLNDATLARGFISAQDRLFQMEVFRHLAHGKLAEFIGERGLKTDRLVRILDVPALARQQLKKLDADEHAFVQAYVDGINAFLQSDESLPFMMRIMKHDVAPWTVHDGLSIQLFVTWGSAANWRQELVMLDLVHKLGADKAKELTPITANPDRQTEILADWQRQADFFDPASKHQYWGSNAWTSDGNKSGTGSAIVSGDPHLDARQLPGFWYPLAMITPEHRIIGTAAPGVPAIGVGRNANVAWAATNGYGDVVDLFAVTLDADKEDHYLFDGQSRPLTIREEIIRVKDQENAAGYREEKIRIRSTAHGPLISDHGMSGNGNRALLLRWGAAENIGNRSGNLDILLAKTTSEARNALRHSVTPLNYLVGDKQGNILRQSTGSVPIRKGDGLQVLPYASEFLWDGFIPFEEMPFELNPAAGWTGSANHDIVPDNYPYAYSTHFSPSWRYRRLKQLFAAETTGTAIHEQALMDTKNTLAEQYLPQLLLHIVNEPELQEMHDALSDWHYFDDPEETGATLFQAWMRAIAMRTFGDELGDELLADYLESHYVWQERLFAMLQEQGNPWFDQRATQTVENRDTIILLAAKDALAHLRQTLGADMQQWQWGRYHSITFFHAFIPGKSAAKWLGGGEHPGAGSPETLNRGASPFSNPRETSIMPSMRIVMDLSQDDHVLAHIPGGNSERLFHRWNKNQLPQFIKGEFNRWWFSDTQIEANKAYELTLKPGS
jgi:penicillin amidase